MSKESPPLQIPAIITKISTHVAGGWVLSMHVPETAGAEVRELVGHENKTQFVLLLVKDGLANPAQKVTGGLTKSCKKKPKLAITQP